MDKLINFCESLRQLKTPTEKCNFIRTQQFQNSPQNLDWLKLLSGEKYFVSEKTIVDLVNETFGASRDEDDKIKKISQVRQVLDAERESNGQNNPEKMKLSNVVKFLETLKSVTDKKSRKLLLVDMLKAKDTSPLYKEYILRILIGKFDLRMTFDRLLNVIDERLRNNFVRTGKLSFAEEEFAAGMNVKPMLANKAEIDNLNVIDWQQVIIEEKMDGQRAVVHKTNNTVKIISRTGKPVAEKLTKLFTNSITSLSDKDFIVDCELMRLNSAGDFVPMKTKVDKTTKSEYKIVVFDVIFFDGRLVVDLPLIERKAILRDNFEANDTAVLIPFDLVSLSELEVAASKKMKTILLANGEGLMLKNPESKYQMDSRSKDWVKCKKIVTKFCGLLRLVTVYAKPGTSKNTKFEYHSFEVAAKTADDNRFIVVGSVSSGLKQSDLERMNAKKINKETYEIADEDREIWLIEASDFFPDTYKMRHPVFKGVADAACDPSPLTFDEYVSIIRKVDRKLGFPFIEDCESKMLTD